MQGAEHRSRRAHTLVIGYGNPLRGDDGFGMAVAEQVSRLLASETVAVIACQQLTPELAEPISAVDTVVFVDVRVGEPIGLIECENLSPNPSASSVTHSLEPAGLLVLARELYGRVPQNAFLLTVRTTHFQYGEQLSPEVERAIPEAVERIRQILSGY
ncbi:MAG: hydrogenase maturation protease [Chthonomonadetes bacterium]|nr:hydrogenase maturation protease [Chthonomonadetes bacterium]